MRNVDTAVFRKMGEKHVVSSAGYEVRWDIPAAIAYIEPPRRMEFSVEGYWGSHGIWQYDIFMPPELKWWAPHQHEALTPEHVDRIKANLVHALNFLYPGVPFELVVQ